MFSIKSLFRINTDGKLTYYDTVHIEFLLIEEKLKVKIERKTLSSA
jgi:hypothetical protein